MALVTPLEGLEETLVSQKGLKRLVKGSNKRSRTPEIGITTATDAAQERFGIAWEKPEIYFKHQKRFDRSA